MLGKRFYNENNDKSARQRKETIKELKTMDIVLIEKLQG
tara:strand:+ start:958 stop:1074 length:117 start_codon:yes stop_codon:yes gene_type:complete